MKMFIEKLCKLLEVKKIIALAMTVVFCILSIMGTIQPEQFVTIFLIIISFYYGQSVAANSRK